MEPPMPASEVPAELVEGAGKAFHEAALVLSPIHPRLTPGTCWCAECEKRRAKAIARFAHEHATAEVAKERARCVAHLDAMAEAYKERMELDGVPALRAATAEIAHGEHIARDHAADLRGKP